MAARRTIELGYWRRTRNLDSGEQLFVEWWGGSAWVLVESTSATSWSSQSFVLRAAAGNNASYPLALERQPGERRG